MLLFNSDYTQQTLTTRCQGKRTYVQEQQSRTVFRCSILHAGSTAMPDHGEREQEPL